MPTPSPAPKPVPTNPSQTQTSEPSAGQGPDLPPPEVLTQPTENVKLVEKQQPVTHTAGQVQVQPRKEALPALRPPATQAPTVSPATTTAGQVQAKINAITQRVEAEVQRVGARPTRATPIALAIRRIQGMSPMELTTAIEKGLSREFRAPDPDMIFGRSREERTSFGVAARARLFSGGDTDEPTRFFLTVVAPIAKASGAGDDHSACAAIFALVAPMFIMEMYSE